MYPPVRRAIIHAAHQLNDELLITMCSPAANCCNDARVVIPV